MGLSHMFGGLSTFDLLARELTICYTTVDLVTDLDAVVTAREGVKPVDGIAQFEQNVDLFQKLVRSAIGRVAVGRTCTHCLPHAGVTLPIELP